ncbi:MAG: hypothetical protein HGA87_02525 [Desulfobulbaceae bacterium]|nr:hypothetical protein [Desulfobulbaceae bacterium]
MKRMLILVCLILGACSTSIPMVQKWPEPPVSLSSPPDLDTLQRGAKLSDMLHAVNCNAGKYYDAAARLTAWNQWYTEQQKIFNQNHK